MQALSREIAADSIVSTASIVAPTTGRILLKRCSMTVSSSSGRWRVSQDEEWNTSGFVNRPIRISPLDEGDIASAKDDYERASTGARQFMRFPLGIW
jgi:hypothetical protein